MLCSVFREASLVCLRSVHMAWILGGLSGGGSQPRRDVVDVGDGLYVSWPQRQLCQSRFLCSKFCYIREG